ncbi:Glycerate dehydrogenase [Petrocella atlantisensis]|uniref:Glycerate dehydrogenase n=1 Tax=Petrocella atlantisensis TaxID=2173034 RepID=A0A3P7P5S5_9FIRM|nr:D-2-hydroxyacid dehydrogenase [Petrocella atlantisensis]VDN48910.1 Glycerate dehydrogenase [Petrocella atlantisensis]
MKIVVLDGYTLNPGDLTWDRLMGLGEVVIYDRTREDQIVERVGECEIVFTNKTPLSKDTLLKLPKVKYIGVLATGYNVVDTQAAKALNMIVTNIPTYGTTAVAQFVFAHLLEICHHVWEHSEEVKQGTWGKGQDFCFWSYPLVELAGKTMGIIGMGRIGQTTAKIAMAFGMNVLAVDAYQNETLVNAQFKYVELDDMLANSDVISLHCPLLESTQGIINSINIAKMKDGVIIINTSRGPLIVEEDLAEALNNGKVAGAGLDVLSVEPAKDDNPLLKAKNCIITPHIAWAPKESRERLLNIAVDNLIEYTKGNPVNVVN